MSQFETATRDQLRCYFEFDGGSVESLAEFSSPSAPGGNQRVTSAKPTKAAEWRQQRGVRRLAVAASRLVGQRLITSGLRPRLYAVAAPRLYGESIDAQFLRQRAGGCRLRFCDDN
jgi:hypothetical protein